MKPTSHLATITQLLERQRAGDPEAFSQLVEVVYAELRTLARRQRRRQGSGGTVSTTAVVHETYLKLVGHQDRGWADRGHFFAVAARAMRQILVDHARARGRSKRGGGAVHVELAETSAALAPEADLTLELDEALTRLEQQDPRAARVFECRYFVGLTDTETAEALGTSPRSVQRSWNAARQWLARELDAHGPRA